MIRHAAKAGLVNGNIVNDLLSLLDDLLKADVDFDERCYFCKGRKEHYSQCPIQKYADAVQKHAQYINIIKEK